MNLIIDIQYFPSVSYYSILYNYSNITFDQYENYQKMSFRNRMIVGTSNGPLELSIPLERGRNQRRPVNEVRIANRYKWQAHHWKALESAYNRSPWFEFYKDSLGVLFAGKFEFLCDWDMACIAWSLNQLKWPLKLGMSAAFTGDYDPKKWVDFRGRLLPKNYQDFPFPIYRQVFEDKLGFLPNLSILDLLFCKGNEAGDLLSR